jgi:hypothetical protein
LAGVAEGTTPQDSLEKNILFFRDLSLSISEWIPFGQNAISTINDTIGSIKGRRESLLTGKVDEAPETSEFKMRPSFTRVILKDFDRYDWIKFTAHIEYPEVVEQVRRLGVHIDRSGYVNTGLRVDRIWAKERDFSIDAATALVAGVVEDTSMMLEALLTQFQQRALKLVYGSSHFRPKFVIATTSAIIPRQESAEGYRDGEDQENEINQLLGAAYDFIDLPNGDQLILGINGIILVSSNPEAYGAVLSLFSAMKALQVFQTAFFTRLRKMWDIINDLRRAILHMQSEEEFSRIEQQLAELATNIVQVEEITSFMRSGADAIKSTWDAHRPDLEAIKSHLALVFDIDRELRAISGKIDDMKMTSSSLVDEIHGLKDMIATMAERRMREMSKLMTDNVQQGSEAQQIMLANVRASRYSSAALQVLSAISAGALGMKLADIIVNAVSSDALGTYVHLAVGFVLWIILTAIFFALIRIGISRVKEQKIAERYNLNVRIPIDMRSTPEMIREFLGSKTLIMYNIETTSHRVAWHHEEKVGDNIVFFVLTLCFDPLNGHIHYLHATTENRSGTMKLTVAMSLRILLKEMLLTRRQVNEIKRRMGFDSKRGGRS